MNIKIQLTREENISYYNKEIIIIDIEEYLKGVVPSEIGNAALEAGKAQAVAARTFALNKYIKSGQITDKSSTDQAFRTSRFSSSYSKAHQAVADTKGQVLYYNNKLVTNAHYSASNGGHTYSSKEVWGGERAYLINRDDPWDYAISKGKKNGHGVGMSQVGAKYAASIGKTYTDILNFYYPNTTIKNNYGGIEEEQQPEENEGGISTMSLTNTDFVKFLKLMVNQPYWYGTCVYKCTSSLLKSKAAQYPTHYTSARMSKYEKAVTNKCVCADCVGLGKGFVWTSGGDSAIAAIGTDSKISSKYGSNGCPDKSANGMFTYAKSKGLKNGTIDTIPEVPGLAVRKDGHVGYYIGNGEVIEAMGFAYGIVITKLNKRPWTHWYEFPGIKYTTDDNTDNDKTEMEKVEYEFGSRTLRKDMSGNDVKELQALLIELDYLPENSADGEFGSKTYAAVKEYQKDNSLTVDGIVGLKTFAELKNDQGQDKEDKEDTSNYPTIKKGSENEYVTILQKLLVSLGYNLGNYGSDNDGIDGSFGTKTQLAVRAFQKAKGLKVDGIVGKATWGALS